MKTKLGIEKFINSDLSKYKNLRLGLLSNQASVNSLFEHSRFLIHKKLPNNLKALFTPQHGFFSEKQDNMIESSDGIDSVLNIPIFSLYGETRRPTKEAFDLIDVLIIDLQDAGTRVYTFIHTMAYCLEMAKKFKKKVLIMDRPNPINGIDIEGNLLEENFKSFVGLYPIPMRYGLTMGEMALFLNESFNINADIEIFKMENWKREMYYNDTKLNWVFPSPNLPQVSSNVVYPGQVILEGTNISEGRGTTLPFEIFGAPFIKISKMLEDIAKTTLKGVKLRPIIFEPTSNKWQNQKCYGFQLHILDRKEYKPYKTTLILLQTVIQLFNDDFLWKQPPYEYEYEKLPIDIIIGSKKIREKIENRHDIEKLEKSWQEELNEFGENKKRYHLY